MSAIRLPGPDGKVRLVPVDDGAVGRTWGQYWNRQMGMYYVAPAANKWTDTPARVAARAARDRQR